MSPRYYYLMFLGTKGWAYVLNDHGLAVRRFASIEEAQAHGRAMRKSVKVIGVP